MNTNTLHLAYKIRNGYSQWEQIEFFPLSMGNTKSPGLINLLKAVNYIMMQTFFLHQTEWVIWGILKKLQTHKVEMVGALLA